MKIPSLYIFRIPRKCFSPLIVKASIRAFMYIKKRIVDSFIFPQTVFQFFRCYFFFIIERTNIVIGLLINIIRYYFCKNNLMLLLFQINPTLHILSIHVKENRFATEILELFARGYIYLTLKKRNEKINFQLSDGMEIKMSLLLFIIYLFFFG